MNNTINAEVTEPLAVVIDDPNLFDAADLLDPCPPLDELVSPAIAKQLLDDEAQIDSVE